MQVLETLLKRRLLSSLEGVFKIPKIHGKAEIRKPINTSIAFSPSMMNINVSTTVQ